MTGLFAYPKSAAFGRVVPKSKIYEHAGTSTRVKDLFVTQVDQIVWRFKLAPETINLAATKAVSEIQVFELALKTGDLDEDVPAAIDRAIPFPLLFELAWDGRRKTMAAYKRPSEADSAKWVVSGYLGTDWMPETAPRVPLPVALDLGALYDKMLTAMMPAEMQAVLREGEDIAARVARLEAIRVRTREVERIKLRLAREKQFNKRVAINAELREAQRALERLTGTETDKA